ncbi:UNVERIFIED_CONTAM: hypothetical protein FKN15_061392 [Acipenser sinensis]
MEKCSECQSCYHQECSSTGSNGHSSQLGVQHLLEYSSISIRFGFPLFLGSAFSLSLHLRVLSLLVIILPQPQTDKKHSVVNRIHATLALKRDVACSICAAFQPRVKEARLERAMKASSVSPMAGPSVALGAPEPLLHDLSQEPLLDIIDAQASRSRFPSPQTRRVKRFRLARDIMDLKAQMAQVLELLAKQALQPQLSYPQGGWKEASQLAQEDTLSIAASREGASSSDMQEERLANNPLPNVNDNALEKFNPVVPWPHVEGVEVDLESIRQKNDGKKGPPHPPQAGADNQQNIMQKQYVNFKPQKHVYPDPVLRSGVLGNFELKEPEPQGVSGGPGEGAKPFVLGPEYKDAIQASVREFGFNMVVSEMISLDRTISDLRHEE